MTLKTITKCDNCGSETDAPTSTWYKINLHPSSNADDESMWIIRDLCPDCTDRVRKWLTGELCAAFRRPRGSIQENGAPAPVEPEP